jgi:hypothetical protein
MAALLELLDYVAEAAAQYAAGSAPAQQSAQAAFEEVGEAATGTGTKIGAWGRGCPRRTATPCWRRLLAAREMLDRLVGQ